MMLRGRKREPDSLLVPCYAHDNATPASLPATRVEARNNILFLPILMN